MAKVEKQIKECNINWVDRDDTVSVTLYQTKYINQVKKLAEEHPDEVKIVAGGRDGSNDGYFVADMPKKYCHVSFYETKRKEMTEEQKAATRERLAKAREAKKKAAEAEEVKEDDWL